MLECCLELLKPHCCWSVGKNIFISGEPQAITQLFFCSKQHVYPENEVSKISLKEELTYMIPFEDNFRSVKRIKKMFSLLS